MKFGSFKIDGLETYGVESSNSVLPVSESFGQTYPNLLAAISSEMTHSEGVGRGPVQRVVGAQVDLDPPAE